MSFSKNKNHLNLSSTLHTYLIFQKLLPKYIFKQYHIYFFFISSHYKRPLRVCKGRISKQSFCRSFDTQRV